jgi:dihydrofolate reductase
VDDQPMPRFVYYVAATLDGFIADQDDGIEWLTGYEGSSDVEGAVEIGPVMDAFIDSVGALAMGSSTYEWIREHVSAWPYGARPSWVFTTRGELPGIEGADLRFVTGEPGALACELAAAAGDAPFWVVGGGGLAASFAEAGLLDEVIVTVVPVVLGSGKPLFGRGLGHRLHLTRCRPFTTGMVELRYAVEA